MDLDNAILTILEQGPISEYQLIKTLQQPPFDIFSNADFNDPLVLFQTHFVTYNALYKLQQQGWQQQLFHLDLIATNIEKHPYKQSLSHQLSNDLSNQKLADYYLDWSHFDNTDENDVLNLLDDFWQRMSNHQSVSETVIKRALKQLNLPSFPTLAILKKQYKLLCIQHHPDKGGCPSEFNQIKQAFLLLSTEIKKGLK